MKKKWIAILLAAVILLGQLVTVGFTGAEDAEPGSEEVTVLPEEPGSAVEAAEPAAGERTGDAEDGAAAILPVTGGEEPAPEEVMPAEPDEDPSGMNEDPSAEPSANMTEDRDAAMEEELPETEAPELDGAAPTVPSNLRWDGITGRWDAVAGAEKYRVELFCVEGGSAVSVGYATPTACEYEFWRMDTSKESTYYFTVCAVNGDGVSEAARSPEASFAPVSAPGNPRWDGKTAKWDAVEGYDTYFLYLMRETGGETSRVWYGFVRNACEKALAPEIDAAGTGAFYFTVSAAVEDPSEDGTSYFYGSGYDRAESPKMTVGDETIAPLPAVDEYDGIDWEITDAGHLVATWVKPDDVPSDADYQYSVTLYAYGGYGSGDLDTPLRTVTVSAGTRRYDFTASGDAPTDSETPYIFGVRLVPAEGETKYAASEETRLPWSWDAITPAKDLARTVDVEFGHLVRAGDESISVWPKWTGAYGDVYYYRFTIYVPQDGTTVSKYTYSSDPAGWLTNRSTGFTWRPGVEFKAGDVVEWKAELTDYYGRYGGGTVFASKTGSFTVEAAVPHTVTLKANGMGQDSSVVVEDCAYVNWAAGYRDAVPTADGYAVAGWSRVQKGLGEYERADLFTDRVTEDMTLYAVWLPAIEEVELNVEPPACGDEAAVPEISIPMDAQYELQDSYFAPLKWLVKGDDGEWTEFEGVIQGGTDYAVRLTLTDYSTYMLAPVFADEEDITITGNFKSGEIEEVYSFAGVARDDPYFWNYGANAGRRLMVIITAAAEHEWGDWTTVKEPTATEEGLRRRVCTACGAEENEAIPMEEHAWGEWTVTREATCTQTGERTRTCADCGETQTETIPRTEHAWSGWTTVREATCTESGERARACSACDSAQAEIIEALGHDWGDWTELKAATIKEDGERTRACARCGETETEVIPAVGYRFLEGMNASWTKGGSEDLRFRANGEFAEFDHAEVDGVSLTEEDVAVSEGSTILELRAAFLETLSPGSHTLAAVYTDGGRATTTFTVKAPQQAQSAGQTKAPAKDGTPKTGDETDIALWAVMLTVSAIGLCAVCGARRRAHAHRPER